MKRREFMILGAVGMAGASIQARGQGLAPSQDITPLIQKLTRGHSVERRDVAIQLPTLAENGNSVPTRISVASPMTPEDHVVAIHLFAERNPRPHVATLHLGPHSGKADVSMRVRLAGTQKVTALAELSGNRFRLGDAEVIVTASACLDETAG
jgi:sulfur-oxidizing protein SoxY